ncbi:DapH/DapD/GlmU-related protein [uncultured Thiodictyon sp.]|jgi:acetyltransferase-like isoleucine patch superfamily enzyme|uniref:acyltransferase n=1 Tax=uncultured Thiodictyon sp. TaxID=1846217 RepID=UPI0025F6DC71|nr:DapH/DapD/GlmU-related protein [uncultured Thiodictyon sp.]
MPGPLRIVRRTIEGLRLGWYRARLGALGAGCHIDPGVSLQYPGRIRLGDGVGIGRHATLRANTDANPGIALGQEVSINDAVVINANRGFVTLGERSWLGPFCFVCGNGGVTIGRNVLVAAHSSINTVSHTTQRCDIPINDQPVLTDPVVIEDDCWIGLNAVILQGVTLGHGCIIGAGAVVTKSIPPWSIAVGVPARVVGRRPGAPEPTGEAR